MGTNETTRGRLKVSPDSRHYRLWKRAAAAMGAESAEPRDLCSYFWGVVFSPLAILFASVGKAAAFVLERGVGGLISLGDVPAAVIVSSVGSCLLTVWGLSSPVSFGVAVGILAAAVIVAVVLIVVSDRLVDRRPKGEPKAPRAKREPSLAWAYVKERKARMCPLIEVER